MNVAKPSADRNLLVGILALQMDFISRDQLVSAMSAWVLAKSRPLEQILVEQAALSVNERELLSALVARHLEKHSQDPEQSLAALSSVEASIVDTLCKLGDVDVEASLSRAAKPSPPAPMATTVPHAHSGSKAERFRVLRPHAKGGLGEVFVASDDELRREVALKRLLPACADDPESRSRFILEAELTGGLEHPGIVPVYGLGQYADGRPFYAMRFIRGDSLKEAIHDFHQAARAGRDAGEQSLRLRKLLGRFIDVCDAVEYAHSRGVLHRDLKPGNVMLGKYGETLVVDWGLAKHLASRERERPELDEPALRPAFSSGSTPTQMGSAIGTPAFMSPEQASGRLDLLGPASDVYSLGATLYMLLTGQPPVVEKGSDMASVLRKVQRGDFPHPRQVAPGVPAPLEAICLKAMALAPADRYASPRALAEDIEHWLADEPVSSFRDPWLARAARWSRRHRVAVAGATMLLLTALVSVSIGAVLLAGANQLIRAAQELAEQNERAAQENFRLASKAVDDYLTTVSQETLLEEPGMQPLRRKLLSDALRYYQDFATEHADDPRLMEELRDANYRVGAITAQIGSQREALTAFQRSLAITEKLLAGDPSHPALLQNLAVCLVAISAQHMEAGELEQAATHTERAMETLEQLRQRMTDDPEVLNDLLSAHNQKASLKDKQGRYEEAVELRTRALEMGQRLATVRDDAGEYRHSLAQAHHNLAVLHREGGRQQQAIEHFTKAVEIRQRLAEEFPHRQNYRSKLGLSLGSLANCCSDLGRFREAVEHHNRAIAIREQLARENPTVTEYHDLLAGSYSNVASDYRQLGDLATSSDLTEKAVAIWKRLAAEHPEVVDYRSSLGTSLYNLGNWHLGNPATENASLPKEEIDRKAKAAIEHYVSAIAVYETLVAGHPNVPEYRADLANAYNNCGSAYSLLKDDAKARELNDKALVVRERLVADYPKVPEYRNQLASTYSNAAGSETDRAKVYELLNRAIELRQKLVDDFPAVPEYRYKLAFSLNVLALQQFLGGERAESMPAFRRIIDLMEQLYAEFPDVPNYRNMLVQALELYAAGQRLTGDWQQAADTERKSMAIFEQLLVKQPGNARYAIGLARAIHGVGKCFHKGDEFQQALDEYGRAIDLLKQLIQRDPPNAAAVTALRGVLEYRVDALESLQRYVEAIADLSELVNGSKDSLELRLRRARFHALSGNHAAAAAEAAELFAGEAKLKKGELYNTACVYALAAAAVKDDRSLAASYVQQAVDCLRKAREGGYLANEKEIEHLGKDADFNAVRQEAVFVEFTKQLTRPADEPR